jgi:histidinol-phosphate aminotransferase
MPMKTQKPKWVDTTIADHISSIPPYVPGKPVEELERELGITGAVKLASNENPLGPSPKALNALRGNLSRLHVYPEDGGPLLRRQIAERWGVSPDHIILGNGSDEVIRLIAHLVIKPGDNAIVADHTFSMYRIVVRSYGGQIQSIPMTSYGFDLNATARAINDKTRIVFLCNPNNPTGAIIGTEDLKRFLSDLPSKGPVVVLDEAYRDYVTDESCALGVDLLDRGVPLLIGRTFSKMFGLAGLRVGYGIAEPWLIELMNRLRIPFTVSSAALWAAAAALDDDEHVRKSLENNRLGLEYLGTALKDMGIQVAPSEANFLMFRLEQDAGPLYEALLRQGVIVRHLASFGLPNCIRVTVGLPEENERFISSLRKTLEASGALSYRSD